MIVCKPHLKVESNKISPVDHIRLHESVGEFKVLINKSLPFLLYVLLLIRDLSKFLIILQFLTCASSRINE